MKRLKSHQYDVPNRTLLVLTILVTAVLSILVWEALRPDVSEAQVSRARAAAVPAPLDSTQQRQALLEAQQATNKKLDSLISLFKSGQARVQVVSGTKPPAPEAKK